MSNDILLPAESCFWGVIDAKSVREEQEKSYLFETQLPFPVDSLHCAYARLPDGRTLAAGVPHDVMRRIMTAEGSKAWSAHPGPPPPHLGLHDIPTESHLDLELLTGVYEPHGRKRYRRLVLACWLSCCAIACCLVLIATEQKRSALMGKIDGLQDLEAKIIDEAVPVTSENRSLPSQARLIQASRRNQGITTGEPMIDAVDLLHQLWSHLPADSGFSLHEAQANQRRLLIRAELQDPGFVQSISDTSRSLSTSATQWILDPPDLPASQGKTFSVFLSWTRRLPGDKR